MTDLKHKDSEKGKPRGRHAPLHRGGGAGHRDLGAWTGTLEEGHRSVKRGAEIRP